MKKRILSVLMVLCLVLAAVPTALAEGEDSGVTPEDPAAPTEVTEGPGNEQQGGGKPAGTLPAGETSEEDSDEKTPANGPTTPAPEETSVPEEQVSPQDVGDPPSVEMDNLLLKTNQAGYLSYEVSDGLDENLLTFEPTEESADILAVSRNSSSVWTATYTGATQVGDTGTINAIYDGQVVGSCQVLFISYNIQ